MIKATNIEWDVNSKRDLKRLPKEIIIPHTIYEDDDDEISDYISDLTGFCHCGFDTEQCSDEEVMDYITEHFSDPLDFIYEMMNLCPASEEIAVERLCSAFEAKYSREECKEFWEKYKKEKA